VPAEPAHAGWRAELDLRFARREARSVLTGCSHRGPLRVQRALYEEGPAVCQAIVVHPPGGVAGGDHLRIRAEIEPAAHALLTTPGAGKWYRSAGAGARQSTLLRLGEDAIAEWLPQEAIVFSGARAHLHARIELAERASYIGWDITCFGRTASGERFADGFVAQSTRITRAGQALFAEHARLEGGSALFDSPMGLAGYPVSGVMLAAGAREPAGLLAQLRRVTPGAESMAGVTALPGIIVARYLGRTAEAARRYFVDLWRILRPALCGVPAQPPRIWRC
jgi:urease accessory protein